MTMKSGDFIWLILILMSITAIFGTFWYAIEKTKIFVKRTGREILLVFPSLIITGFMLIDFTYFCWRSENISLVETLICIYLHHGSCYLLFVGF